jgi:lichenan operon transcriptional antiterminator
MSSILYNETEEKFFDIDLLKSFFEDYDIDYIRNVVVEIFSLHHYFTNDFSLANIVVHIAVAIERMKNGFIFTKQLNREPEIGKDYVMASEIAKKLEGKFDLEYTEEEIRDLSLLISSSGTSFNFMHLQLSDLQNIADIKCLNLVEKIFEDLQSSYDLTFGDSDFLIRFTLHIKNLLMRLENHYFSKNPLTATIKLTCPFIYDCAVHVSYTIKEVTGFTLNDDEIAYIAFHLGYTIELQKQSDSKITCSILFPFYYNYNVQLTEKLKSLFNEDLLIQHIVTNENELNALNSDLIISTIQLHSTPKIPYVVINPFFANGDQNKVTNKIKELKEIKKKNLFKQNLESITSEQLFQIVHSGGIKEEILEMMCKIMEEKKLVSPGFLSNVKERELMSSTAFGYMAIPHGIKMNANKTSMFTLINKKGIRWNDQIVNIIFLFAVSKDDKRIFHDIIDSLASILTEEKNVLEIMNATDFSTFVDMLVNAY